MEDVDRNQLPNVLKSLNPQVTRLTNNLPTDRKPSVNNKVKTITLNLLWKTPPCYWSNTILTSSVLC